MTVVVVVGAGVAAYLVLENRSSPSSSGSPVVVPHGIYYTIPGSQFNAVAFGCDKEICVLNGTLEVTDGNVTIYTMTPADLSSETTPWRSFAMTDSFHRIVVASSKEAWDVVTPISGPSVRSAW